MKLLASGLFAIIAVLEAAAGCGFEQAEVHIGYHGRKEEIRIVACQEQPDGAWRFHMPVSQIPRDAWYVDVFTQGASPAKGEGYWVTGDCNHGKLTRDKGFVETAIMRLPIFGVAAPGGSFVAIVKTLRGEFTHQVRAGGGRYRISPRFKIEKMEFDPYADIVVDYYPLSGDNANYSGMARKYREWQLARGEVKPLKEKVKGSEALKWSTESIFLRCKFGRSVRKGIDHRSFITNTPPMIVDHTFDDFMEIMRKCKALGMDKVDMCMVGWQPGGHDGPFPDLFPPDDRFGGEAKMREAIAFGKSLGYRMSVHVNWHNYYSSSKRWCVEDVAKGLDGKPRIYAKLPVLPAGRCYDACYDVMCNRYVDDDIARLLDLGLDGMLHMDVMSAEEPTPCHDSRHPATRGDMIRWEKAIGEKARLHFGGSSSESGFDQFASALDNILYVAWAPREHPMCDGMLPLFPIVYNGIVMSQPFYATIDAPCHRSKDEMMSEAFKAFLWIPSAADRVLKVFEWGGRPMFYYTMYTERDLADIKRMYDEWQPLKHLQLEFIHEHVTLAPGVTATRYENGEEVVCNASDAPVDYRGATVGPHAHRLFGPAEEGAHNGGVGGWGPEGYRAHIVNFMQGLKTPPLKWLLGGGDADRTAFRAALAPNGWVMRKYGRPDRTANGTEPLSSRSASQGTELCATAEHILSAQVALETLGDADIADDMEVAAYNTLPATLSPDGKGMRYYCLLNQPFCVNGDLNFRHNGKNYFCNVPGPYSGFGCCRSNFHFAWPKFAESMWMRRDGGLAAVAYGDCTVACGGPGAAGPATIRETGGYPFSDAVKLEIVEAAGGEWPLFVRIPGWCRDASVKVNGGECGERVLPGAFVRLSRKWQKGDVVELTFPSKPVVTRWKDDSVAVTRGPLLYALRIDAEEKECETGKCPLAKRDANGALRDRQLGFPMRELRAKSPWNYALVANGADGEPRFETKGDGPGRRLLAKAVRTGYAGWGTMLADAPARAEDPPPSPVPLSAAAGDEETIELVPLAFTQLRITLFPWILRQ